MHDLSRAVIVRQVEDDQLDVRKQLAQRLDAGVVRPVAPSDEERLLVEPDRVAAFRERRRVEPPGDRDSCFHEVGGHCLRLGPPLLLAGPKENGAGVRDDGGVVGIDRIGVRLSPTLAEHDLRPVRREQLSEGRVLLGHRARVGLVRASRTPPRRLRPRAAGRARARAGARQSCSDSQTGGR